MAGRVTALGGEIITLPLETKNPVTIVANGQRLANIARRRSVSLLHARSRAPAWSALMAAPRAGVPFVTTYHGAYGERGTLKRLYNSVMARGDAVIANSRYTADLIRARYGAAHGVFGTVYDIGDAIGPIAGGLLVANLGYAAMFRVMAAVALVMALAFAIASKATAAEREGELS